VLIVRFWRPRSIRWRFLSGIPSRSASSSWVQPRPRRLSAILRPTSLTIRSGSSTAPPGFSTASAGSWIARFATPGRSTGLRNSKNHHIWIQFVDEVDETEADHEDLDGDGGDR